MKDVPYESQIGAICDTVEKRKLGIEKVAEYYKTWRANAKQAYPHAKIPAVYHQFLAERETWTQFFPIDHFPGKDPLFDCFMSALDDTEKGSQPHIKEEDDEAFSKVSQLQEIIRQKELLIQSKDELLGVKDEALRASKELLAQKDKMREDDLQHASRLIRAREQTIADKDEVIRNREDNLQQAQITITAHEFTIAQNLEAYKKLKRPRNDLYQHLSNKDKMIEQQQQTIDRLNDNLRVKGIKNKELIERWNEEAAVLHNQVVEKDHRIRELEQMLEKLGSDGFSQMPNMESRDAIRSRSNKIKRETTWHVKDEGSEDGEILSPMIKVKAEPMDY